MPLDSADIQELAKALQTVASASPAPAPVNAVSIKLPEFWTDDPELWFARVEAQFATRGIKDQDTQFNYIAAALDNASAGEVKSILLRPPTVDKYKKLKSALINTFAKSQAQKDAELLAISGLGDRKPTALLRRIQALNSNTDTLLRAFFLAQLPEDVRAMLAAANISGIEDLAKAADRVMESKHITQQGCISDISQVRDRKRNNDGVPKTTTSEFICYFHGKFGTKARSCRPGCLFADLRLSTDVGSSKSFPKKSTSGNETAGR